MTRDVYRYAFTAEVPVEEVEASLLLAVLATESLHGESQTRLDAAHFFDPAKATESGFESREPTVIANTIIYQFDRL